MKKFELVFITTFLDLRHIGNLLQSISDSNKTVSLFIVVVAQNGISLSVDKYEKGNIEIKVLNFDILLSLSSARNNGLRYIFDNNIDFGYLMFPDDDTTSSVEFFENFRQIVSQNTLIDVYCQGSKELFKSSCYNSGVLLKANNYEMAMSVNMIIQYQTLKAVGDFDEKMGVGAKYGAGEDCDYFIRSCKVNNEGFKYEKRLWNFHPKGTDKYKTLTYRQLLARFKTYGQGGVYLLYKHEMYREVIKLILRGLGGSMISIVKLDFKMSYVYLYAFWQRLKTFVKLCISSVKKNAN